SDRLTEVAHDRVVVGRPWLRPHPVDSTRRPMGLLPDRCSTFYIAPCHTRNMRARVALRLGSAAIAAAVLLPINAAASTPRVEEADLNGDINPIMSSYIPAALNRAEADHAAARLAVVNPPGGTATSLHELVT